MAILSPSKTVIVAEKHNSTIMVPIPNLIQNISQELFQQRVIPSLSSHRVVIKIVENHPIQISRPLIPQIYEEVYPRQIVHQPPPSTHFIDEIIPKSV